MNKIALISSLIFFAIAPSAAAQSSEPISEALARAEQYWGGAPCGGNVTVKMGTAAEVTYVDPEHQVAAWATFVGAAGPNSVAAPPSTYTNCVVTLNPNDWGETENTDVNFETFCQLMTHEIGHFEGYADQGAQPGTIQYVFPDEAPTVPTCLHYDMVFNGDHFRGAAEEAAAEHAEAQAARHHKHHRHHRKHRRHH